MKRLRYTTLCCALLLITSLASAGTVTEVDFQRATGLNSLGAYSANLKYDTTGMLWVSLANLSPLANGGTITGFVFNINGDASASYVPILSDTFANLNGGSVNAAPFGEFEHGAAIGGNFLGGGSTNSGIAVGDSRTFKFNVTGIDAGSLAAADFFSELSTGTGAGADYQTFVVRLRGFEDDGSDKVPGTMIPSPAAFGAGLSLLACLGLTRRRR